MGDGRSVLGRFLGFGVNARQRAASFDFYRSLGFEPVPVADGESAPYAALSDGTIAIGLHDRPDEAGDGVEPSIAASFVRPNLTSCVRTYRRLGIELEIERLASDEFNEVGFTDPSGLPIRVLEARTFSPAPADARHAGACGTFLELAVAARSVGHSQTFWEALGFKTVASSDEPDRWRRLEGYGLTLGLYEGRPFPAGLSFRGQNLEARIEYLKAKGFDVRRGPAALGPLSAALTAPEGTPLYLVES